MAENRREAVLSVGGMTCSGCELRIESKLNALSGVVKARASRGEGKVRVAYRPGKVTPEQIRAAIREVGYTTPGDGAKKTGGAQREKQSRDYHGFAVLAIIAAAYLLIQNTVGFNFIPQIDQNMSYGVLFVVGLITSLHCLAMCGGISLSQCVGERTEGGAQRILPSLLYNAGRVISYTVIGGVVGAAGSVVGFSGRAKGIVAILSGIFMVLMGLNLMNLFPKLHRFLPRMPKAVGARLQAGKVSRGPFYVGLLNGLMPCGPLQAMQLYALGTGSLVSGALSMLVFSLGTVPLMFSFGAASSFLSAKFTKKMMRVGAALVVVLGIGMMGRGFGLSGISFGFAAAGGARNTASVSENVQEITTPFSSGQYVPITVKKGIPVRWTIRVQESDLNGCNNPVTIPSYGIQKELVPGDNVITFTPQKTGTIVYTCWMGMIQSTITVV